MRLEFEPPLVEAAVRLATRDDPELDRALHREIDPIYRIENEELRDAAFTRVFGEAFGSLALDEPLLRRIGERPRIGRMCSRGIVRDAGRRSAEGVELFVRDEGCGPFRTLLIQVLPDSLVRLTDSPMNLRRELFHVDDMLSEDFGFRADDLATLGKEDSLIRDRYRVLWDLAVEARLIREERSDGREFPRLHILFNRAFTVRGRPPAPALFDAARRLDRITHDAMLHLARHPDELIGTSREGRNDDATRCALCGCTTYDWFEVANADAARLTAAVSGARPDWTPGTPTCRQCMEAYASFTPLEVTG